MKITYSEKMHAIDQEPVYQALHFLLIQMKSFPQKKLKKASAVVEGEYLNFTIEMINDETKKGFL